MLLIISNHLDSSTSFVIKWLLRYDVDFFRLNDEDKISVKWLDLEKNVFQIIVNEDKILDLTKVTSLWYRRGNFSFVNNKLEQLLDLEDSHLQDAVTKCLNAEEKRIQEFIYYYLFELKKIAIVNRPQKRNVNKLIALTKAKQFGFKIPAWIVTDTDDVLSNYTTNNFITKSCSNGLRYRYEDVGSKSLTFRYPIDKTKVKNTFFPSFLQDEIKKKYELRVFYWFGETYSMGLFSQSNEDTEVDYRNYNIDRRLRTKHVTLPDDINEKIKSYMVEMELESGSLDFIVDKENQFYFLEVNPVGQFGMVSGSSNYNLEKIIAEHLSNEN